MKKLPIILVAAVISIFGSSCISTGVGFAKESVDVGFGVHTAPDGWTYGPAKVRLKNTAGPE